MSKAVVISGGALDEGFVETVLAENEGAYIIGVDRGLEYLYHHNIKPHYIVGDFDSIEKEIIEFYKNETNIPVREYNPIKDATDTEIAVRFAITLGSKEIIILGATGGRIDHLWANMQTLAIACEAGVNAYIMDKRNRIRVIDKPCTLKKEDGFGEYVSVFSLSGDIFNFNMTGAKWPLHGHTLKPYDSLTVSNQYAEDQIEISFASGVLIVMETRDE